MDHTILDLNAEEALFGSADTSPLDGLVATFHANERPLQGLAGWLDWRFQGAISSYLRAGALTGREGEYAYTPMRLPLATDGPSFSSDSGGRRRIGSPRQCAVCSKTKISRSCARISNRSRFLASEFLASISADRKRITSRKTLRECHFRSSNEA